ncbi:MAG: glutamine-synthetase adenylyltransferase, partial [Alphaproteobacteria bacterium]|nr:glutamine-synthetase adenylyltransferase [Alphaproteobacteria bacterium]
LTRARVVTATTTDIDDRSTTVICETLARSRDADRLLVDVADMRLRMASQHKGESRWDVKHHRGGLVDIEFIAQYLQLLHGPTHPRAFAENTADALGRLGEAGIIGIDSVAKLVQALELWWRLQDALRLMVSASFVEETAPAALKAALARAASQPDFETLCGTMDTTYATVRDLYRSIVDEPAEDARRRLPPDAGI